MGSFNKVVLMGNLTRTPELRSTPGGTQVCEVSLAVNENYTDSSGQKQERVSFIDVVFWGKSAEVLCRWKVKGDPLLVEGRLQQDTWTDKETGKNRSKLKVISTQFVFIGGAKKDGKGGDSDKERDQRNREQFSGEGGYDDYATSLPDGGEEPPF